MNILKVALIGVALALGVVDAKADVAVQDVANSSNTLNVTVSSATATAMDATCVPGGTRKLLEIQNLDTSANLFCDLVQANVSSTAGHKITPGLFWDVKIPCYDRNQVRMQVWCVNDSGSGTKKAFVLQLGNY